MAIRIMEVNQSVHWRTVELIVVKFSNCFTAVGILSFRTPFYVHPSVNILP